MSQSRACELLEFRPQQWYLFLEGRDTGKADWREDASCDGPFPSEAMTVAYLQMRHANPGMSETVAYNPQHAEATDSPVGRKIAATRPVSPSVLAELAARVSDPEREARQQLSHVAAAVAQHERMPRRRFP